MGSLGLGAGLGLGFGFAVCQAYRGGRGEYLASKGVEARGAMSRRSGASSVAVTVSSGVSGAESTSHAAWLVATC